MATCVVFKIGQTDTEGNVRQGNQAVHVAAERGGSFAPLLLKPPDACLLERECTAALTRCRRGENVSINNARGSCGGCSPGIETMVTYTITGPVDGPQSRK